MQNHLKDELHHVISGKSQVRFGELIQPITSYLKNGERTSAETQNAKSFKSEEAERLTSYISEHHLWIKDIDLTQYISEGAEQKVYLKDFESVLKLNDSIYYNSWKDYLINLLLHNYFFPDTAYQLVGFTIIEEILYAIVEQPYVAMTEKTDLMNVKNFMTQNGFENIRNHDYYHPELGIILEDLHDENVLTRNGILYFIDTVFYLTEEFYN